MTSHPRRDLEELRDALQAGIEAVQTVLDLAGTINDGLTEMEVSVEAGYPLNLTEAVRCLGQLLQACERRVGRATQAHDAAELPAASIQ